MDNMNEQERMQHRSVMLDLLSELQRVCAKEQLKVYATRETLLGAARYGGMCPWSNSLSMMMTREDYLRLCSIAREEFAEPYFLQTEYSDPESLRGYAQLRNSRTTAIVESEKGRYVFNQGIFISVFPLDNVPDDDDTMQKHFENIRLQQKHVLGVRKKMHPFNVFVKGNQILKSVTQPIDRWLREKNMANRPQLREEFAKLEQLITIYNGKRTARVAVTPLCDERFVLDAKSFRGTPETLPFEGLMVSVPDNYQQMLETMYGDWQNYTGDEADNEQLIIDTLTPYIEHPTFAHSQ